MISTLIKFHLRKTQFKLCDKIHIPFNKIRFTKQIKNVFDFKV